MAIYWQTPGFKGRTFKLCVVTRWNFNFCVRSSPLWGTGWRSIKFESGFVDKMNEKKGRQQSPAARQSREWMVLRCCCRWSPFESFQWDKIRTTIEQCRRYHRDFQVCREEFSNRWYRRQQTSPREIRQTCCHRPKHAVCHLSLSVAPSQCCALHGRLIWRSRTGCWKKGRQRVETERFFFF